MASNLDPPSGPRSRRKALGVGVLLAFLIVLVLLWFLGLGLWGSGEMATPPNP
jgi:hypothetical protein